MTRDALIAALPPYRNKSVEITANQDVDDIIHEVCAAHKYFADDYNNIAEYFYTGDLYTTCRNLFNFCRDNIAYRIEKHTGQTTKSPGAMLTHGYGDCKHYAGFIAGVLDAINRAFGSNIKWHYRFASYDMMNDLPQHVFVVVKDGPAEIWIDPVLPSFDQRLEPSYITNKKVSTMLNRISGTNDLLYDITYQQQEPAVIGWTIETSAGYTTTGPTIIPKIGHDFYGTDFLGLSRYGATTNTDLNVLTGQLQALIDKAGYESYKLSPDLVKTVLRDNIQNWNFFYSKGTSPKARPWKNHLSDFLMMTVTPDGRLTFDRNAEPPHNSALTHYVVDQMNYLVQAYSDKPYIVTMEHAKRLGKGWNTPAEGSAWHVIHTGDVNFTKVSDFIDKIPGLKELAATFGLNIDSLIQQAGKYLGVGGNTSIPGATQPNDPGVQYGGTTWLPWALLVAGGALYMSRAKTNKSKVLPLVLAGAGAFMLMKDKPQLLPGLLPGGANTATPPFMGTNYLFQNSPDGVFRQPETHVPADQLHKPNAAVRADNLDQYINEYKNFD